MGLDTAIRKELVKYSKKSGITPAQHDRALEIASDLDEVLKMGMKFIATAYATMGLTQFIESEMDRMKY